jgi:hypothetical protein
MYIMYIKPCLTCAANRTRYQVENDLVSADAKTCSNNTPPWFAGHWRDWHRGHGCDRDDGAPRSEEARAAIAQHEALKGTVNGFLTDDELILLRARTAPGDTLLVRALDELRVRRAGGAVKVRGRGKDPKQHACETARRNKDGDKPSGSA